jgi:purine catabolism regulator
MLTVADALEMPAFAGATLVAGGAGLSNMIRWVHIVDIPDATYEWARGGELLLTTGFGLDDDPARQQDLIPRLAQKGLSGLVISVGHYLIHTPQAIISAADAIDFPVIEVPPQTAFITITEAVFNRIVNQHYELRRRAEDIHHTLTQLVLDGGSLQDVAHQLANILDCSITIESASFEVLATTQVGTVDEARRRSVEAGRTTPDIAQHLLEVGIYDRLMTERCPIRVPPMTEFGMDIERIVAPILVARQIIGYVWIIAGDRHLNDLDALAIEHAATIAALIMDKERAVGQVIMAQRGDLLAQALNIADPPDSAFVELAHRLDFKLDSHYQVLAVKGHAPASEAPLPDRIENWISEVVPALVVMRGGRIIVILQSRRPMDGKHIAQQLVSALSHPADMLLIGVGRHVENLTGLPASYDQAIEALDVAAALGKQEGVLPFAELGVLHWLRNLPSRVYKDNAYVDAVEKLAAYDTQHASDLLQTLETYLDMGTIAADSASLLHVHRNTLAYRLERIEELTNLSLKDAECRLNLHVAVKSRRLIMHGAQ